MLDQTSQWYKLQYPECFVNEELRMMQKTLADFVDNEIMPVRDKIDDDVTHEEIITPILKKLQVGLGYQKNMIPLEYDGNQMLPMVGAALRQEQMSRGDYGISLHSACTEWDGHRLCWLIYHPLQPGRYGQKQFLMNLPQVSWATSFALPV